MKNVNLWGKCNPLVPTPLPFPKNFLCFISNMFRSLIKVLYVPFRFNYITVVSLFTTLGYLFSNKRKYTLGRFYQTLFDRLGGAFIKAGQALAMRQDKLPLQHCEALSSLLDEVRPFPAAKGIAIIEKELGKPIGELFESIEPKPVASASFSQVYKAMSKEGKGLAVKVKRPRMEQIVFADAFFIRFFAFLISLTGLGRRLRVREMAGEVVNTLYEELDYQREADFLKISWRYTKEISHYRSPQYYREFSTRNLITMDFMEGISLREVLSRLRNSKDGIVTDPSGNPLDLPEIGSRLYEIILRCIFEMGFFHADPHPGNIIIMEDGNLGFIDFGIMGYLTTEVRKINLKYQNALSRGHIEEATEIFTQIVTPGPDADVEGLKRDMNILLQVWTTATRDPNAPFEDKSSAIILQKSVEYARKHRFFLAQNEVLYYKTLLTIDHLNIELNPAYDSVGFTEEYLRGYFQRKVEGDLAVENFMEQNEKLRDFITHTPDTLNVIREILEKQLEQNQDEKKEADKGSWGAGFMGKMLLLLAVSILILKYGVDHPLFQHLDHTLTGVILGIKVIAGILLIRRGQDNN